MQRDEQASTRPPRWWVRELASVQDPISLDPIRTLRYAPFELRANYESGGHSDSDWYDGAGGSYVLQPLT